MKIVTVPNPVLSATAAPINKVDKETLKLIAGMKKILSIAKDPQGVGLAAPQVDKSLQIFLAKPTQKSKFLVFINPKIISASETMQELNRPRKSKKPARLAESKRAKLEGCLSLQNIWGTVLRHKEIKLSYLNEKGVKQTKTFDGFLSIIIQHEIDHLNGVLFPKRVLEQNGKLYKSHKNAKGEDEFEEIEI